MSTRNYDPKDFAANPGKYRLFKTATLRTHVFTENGANDLSEGAIVALAYVGEAYNPLYRRNEPLYRVGDNTLYANAFTGFTL